MTNKTVFSKEEVQRIKKQWQDDDGAASVTDLIQMAGQAALQSPEIQQALADTKRLDFLADKDQTVANVLLPIDVVMNNMGDMRAAIDEVMEAKP